MSSENGGMSPDEVFLLTASRYLLIPFFFKSISYQKKDGWDVLLSVK